MRNEKLERENIFFLGYVTKQPGGDGGLWLRAHNSIDEAAIFEYQHGGNTLYLKLRGSARIVIDI
jgi:hypothetical protein